MREGFRPAIEPRVDCGLLLGFQPENYADEDRKRLQRAIDQRIVGQDIQRAEVEARAPTTDLVASLKASLERKAPTKAPAAKSEQEAAPAKRPAGRRRAS
jgi:non-homologous end joining protein Ku